MIGAGLYLADTDAEARRLFTSVQMQFAKLFRGNPGELEPPCADIDAFWTSAERVGVERALRSALVGSPATVRAQLGALLAQTAADEVMFATQIHDHAARLRSYELGAALAAEAVEATAPARAAAR